MRRALILIGILFVLAGLVWPWLGRLGLGHLPGDIRLKRPGFFFFFPLGSSIVISLALSLLLSLLVWLFRR